MSQQRLYVHISIEIVGENDPAVFASKVDEALPTMQQLVGLRENSIGAMLPVTFRLERKYPSNPQNYLQFNDRAIPDPFTR